MEQSSRCKAYKYLKPFHFYTIKFDRTRFSYDKRAHFLSNFWYRIGISYDDMLHNLQLCRKNATTKPVYVLT